MKTAGADTPPSRQQGPRAASTRHPRSRLAPQGRGPGVGRSSRNLRAGASALMPQDLTSSAPAVAGPPYPRASPSSPPLPPPRPPSRLGTASSPPPRRTWPPYCPSQSPGLTAVPLNCARVPRTRPRAPPHTPPYTTPAHAPRVCGGTNLERFILRSPSPGAAGKSGDCRLERRAGGRGLPSSQVTDWADKGLDRPRPSPYSSGKRASLVTLTPFPFSSPLRVTG